jgi:hypothetical protein
VTFQDPAWARRAAGRQLGELDGARTIATILEHPDGLIPLLARCTLAMPGGVETRAYTRAAPAPEYGRVPDWLRRGVTGCIHGIGWPLMRRGVRDTQRMDQAVYPPPPGATRN